MSFKTAKRFRGGRKRPKPQAFPTGVKKKLPKIVYPLKYEKPSEPEPEENIIVMCPKCAKKMYPAKGRYTSKQLKFATHVKKGFKTRGMVEHMWVKITAITPEGVIGTVDNVAICRGMPKLGEQVLVKYKEIEDVT